ncbi:MAG TPA: nucleoside phosphorylase [Candidatus Binatus sp.]|uniref:nucleoside phosphorylase n=1 Tax=Candidatus Binatus sp. TaxID=2811406 RepID=UPI002F405099
MKSRRPKSRTPKRLPTRAFPIIEYDPSPAAIIEPRRVYKRIDAPKHCVLCFFQDVIDELVRNGARVIHDELWETGKHPVYELDFNGRRLAVLHPRVGAPVSAAMLELMIALGSRKFVACGGAGVLDSKIAVGHIIVPNSAVRDEGTSYHYIPPSREVAPHPRALAAIEKTLRRNGMEYIVAKTWTTDGILRETRARMLARRREGCLTVEMEAAAFFAVAQFRRVQFGQILYGGDDLGGDDWDHRNWNRHQIRERLFTLAAEACLSM